MRKKVLLKRSRRFIENILPTKKLTLKQQKFLEQKRKVKLSKYGELLFMKRFLSLFYGNISNHFFRSYYHQAQRFRGKFSSIFITFFERRLDIALYRLNWVPTIQSGRQLINHGKIFVNFQPITSPALLLQPGDIISICPTSRPFFIKQYFKQKTAGNSNLLSRFFLIKKSIQFEVNYKIFTAVFLYSPQQVFYSGKVNIALLSQMRFMA